MVALHCVKSVRIRSFSDLYFPAFGVNTNQKNSVSSVSANVQILHSDNKRNIHIFLNFYLSPNLQ